MKSKHGLGLYMHTKKTTSHLGPLCAAAVGGAAGTGAAVPVFDAAVPVPDGALQRVGMPCSSGSIAPPREAHNCGRKRAVVIL